MEAKIEDLIGKTINKIDVQDDLILFHCKDGAVFKMQDIRFLKENNKLK